MVWGPATLWSITDSTLEKVIWALFAGVVVAILLTWYNINYLGKPIRALCKRRAYKAENSYTLAQLGLDKPLIRRALSKKSSTLRKLIYCTSDKGVLNRADFATVGFYIPEHQKERAQLRYKTKHTNLLTVIIGILLMLVAVALCLRFFPYIVEEYSNLGGTNNVPHS